MDSMLNMSRQDFILTVAIAIASIILLVLLIRGGKKKPLPHYQLPNRPAVAPAQPKAEPAPIRNSTLQPRIESLIAFLGDTLRCSFLAEGTPKDADPSGTLSVIVTRLQDMDLGGTANRVSESVKDIETDIIELQLAFDRGEEIPDDIDITCRSKISALWLKLQLAETAFRDEEKYLKSVEAAAKKIRLVYSK